MIIFTVVAGVASILGLGVSGWTLFKVYQIKQGYDFIIHAERAQRKLKALEKRFLHLQDASGIPSGKVDAELRGGISVLSSLSERVPVDRARLLKDASEAIEAVLDAEEATEEDYWRVYGELTQVVEVIDDLIHSRKLQV